LKARNSSSASHPFDTFEKNTLKLFKTVKKFVASTILKLS